ncbi:DUF4295 family protein [Membranihabitans maritimus]|uniref:DUF4295 family protein n=1 Tax=Membranihabitans maritimus TaxID=2904244 RepID=UPI001F418193|nr:DUF4295 family protein [Membranihabitans maritimus]
MAKKVSKNARVAQRAANAGSGRDHVKVIKSIKDPVTGKYSFKEMIVHKDKSKEFFANK